MDHYDDSRRVVRSEFGSELEAPNAHHRHVKAVLSRWHGAAAERDGPPDSPFRAAEKALARAISLREAARRVPVTRGPAWGRS